VRHSGLHNFCGPCVHCARVSRAVGPDQSREMASVPVSRNEIEFTLQALRRENIRTDGRALSAYRRFGLRFGAAHGEVEANFGPTRALAVCSGEVITPPPERPNEGRIAFHVEFGPIASPSFEAGRPSVQATALSNFIERLLRGSHAIDTEALCIVGGQKVWSIRVDVRALDDDGNLGDVCAIAALCSLMHFRKADVDVRGEEANVFAAEERCPVPLSIHHIPVPVTFALFAASGSGGAKDHATEPAWLLDPNRLEEAATVGGVLCVAVNEYGELCGLHKPGGMPVDVALIEHFVELATARAKEITSRIQSELKADLEKRQQLRRNVHQRYAQGELLSVAWTTPVLQEAPAPQPVPLARRRVSAGKRTLARAASPLNSVAFASADAPTVEVVAVGDADAVVGLDFEDSGDLFAELEAVEAEAAELEMQLAAATEAEIAATEAHLFSAAEMGEAADVAPSITLAAGAAVPPPAPSPPRKVRKKRRKAAAASPTEQPRAA